MGTLSVFLSRAHSLCVSLCTTIDYQVIIVIIDIDDMPVHEVHARSRTTRGEYLEQRESVYRVGRLSIVGKG
jgi:hypothetical protein